MIVVTGMHRSGTSLLCQLLHRLGFVVAGADAGDGDDVFPTDRWNAPGYFESKAVMDVNSEIVTGFRRNRTRFGSYISRLRYAMLPGRGGQDRRAARLGGQLGELACAHRDHVVKDPRFCLTLRYWLAEAEIERVVVCLRRPDAVVESMRRRDGMPAARGFRFYDYHVASLLEQLPAERSALLDMDAIAAGRGAGEFAVLRASLGLGVDVDIESAGRAVVQPDLYRRAGVDLPSLPASTRSLWERLATLAEARRRALLQPGERA